MNTTQKPAGTLTVEAACAVNWLENAYTTLKTQGRLCVRAAFLVLFMRLMADRFEAGGGILLLSYLTDALIFVAAVRALQEKTGLWKGLRSFSGQTKTIVLTSLWGLSSAAMGEATYVLAEPTARAIAVISGQPALGAISGLITLLIGTYLAMLLLTGGVLAALDAAETDGGFKVSGTWGLLSAWRLRQPLAAIFFAFISATLTYFLCVGLLLKRVFPDDWDSYAACSTFAIGLMLLVAVSTFIALLPSMMAEARGSEGEEYDVSDDTEANHALAQFLTQAGTLCRTGGWLLLAASLLISGSMTLIRIGLCLLMWGFACRGSATHWQDSASKWKKLLPLFLASLASVFLLDLL